jgi:hypothetical protein
MGLLRKYNKCDAVCKDFFASLSIKLNSVELLFPAQIAWNFPWIKPSLDRIFGKADDLPKVKRFLFNIW